MKQPSWSSPRLLALTASLVCGLGFAALTMTPRESAAFCGFYVASADAKLFNAATVVVLMRDGTRTVLSMQNDYQGPPEDFALVIPVPTVLKEGDVQILRSELFDRVDALGSPRLVEYWERDPCNFASEGTIGLDNLAGYGRGVGSSSGSGNGSRSTVVIEAEFAVGEYDIVILSATESSGLETWLHDNDYNIPAGAEPLLRPYVQQDMKFFVAKVDPKKVKFAGKGRAKLSPLRFHYDSEDFVLPVRLGLINAPDPKSGGKQDLIVHILAPELRYQLANYPNVTIPTNLDLEDSVKDRFGEFYVALLDHTLEQHPGAIVTEYAWGVGSCDPCPGPDAALTNKELIELGADVLPNWAQTVLGQKTGVSVPIVRHAKAHVEGDLDRDIIRRIVRSRITEVRSCYYIGLLKDPLLAGRLELEFTIASDGRVRSTSIGTAEGKVGTGEFVEFGDPAVGECVAKAAKLWVFPKPGAGEVQVRYPFNLERDFFPGGSRAASTFVLTRLHARYDASSLAEDLVFEAAPAITGGRESFSEQGELEKGATILERGINNFQARYAIRHAWAGELACANPVHGRWDGPPLAGGDLPRPKLARQLSEATRGASLASFITASAGEQIGVAALSEPPPSEPPPAKPPEPSPSTSSAREPGCACKSESQPELPGGALVGLLALLGLRRRQTSDRASR